MGQNPPDSDDLRAAEATRLRMLDAFHAAILQRSDLLDLVADAESPEEAIPAVSQLLGVGEEDARAVLDLQFQRLTKQKVRSLEHERERLRTFLESG